jgi:hypothetical protein
MIIGIIVLGSIELARVGAEYREYFESQPNLIGKPE